MLLISLEKKNSKYLLLIDSLSIVVWLNVVSRFKKIKFTYVLIQDKSIGT